jgi:hypothetical protein
MRFLIIAWACLLCSWVALAENAPSDITAVTGQDEKVILHPNGRWEFADSKKAAQAAEIAKQFPENQGCPPGTQGGYFGLGRCISVGDKDFNRGSASGKGR